MITITNINHDNNTTQRICKLDIRPRLYVSLTTKSSYGNTTLDTHGNISLYGSHDRYALSFTNIFIYHLIKVLTLHTQSKN